MALLEDLFRTGRIVDLMLLLLALEVLALTLYRYRSGARLALLLNVGSGVSLMLALRFSLTGAGWVPVAICLVTALAFHVADVTQRVRAGRGG